MCILDRRRVSQSLVAIVLLGASGCAQVGGGAAMPPTSESVVTGSRLPQPVDPATGRPVTPSIERTYDRGQLEQTGKSDPGSALKQLDSSVR